MAKCRKCGSETGLNSNGVPICLRCAGLTGIKRRPHGQSIDAILRQELIRATKRNRPVRE